MLQVRRGLAFLLVSACGATDPGGTAGVEGSGGVCGAPPDAIVLQGGCPLPLACPVIDRYGGGAECTAYPLDGGALYSSAETCVLEHLSSGTPGRIIIEGACGRFEETITLSIVATGEAILSVESREPCDDCECGDVRRIWGPLDECELAAIEVFAECLEEAEPAGRVACMTPETWLRGCAPTSPRCVGR